MAAEPTVRPRRLLVVKLADIGDALLATPAIRALRETFPGARLDVLTTPAGQTIFRLVPGVDRIVPFPKALFDEPRGLARPAGLARLVRLAAGLRAAHYDAVVLLHHLTTGFGVRKFQALCLAAGAPIVAGLDNGAGTFLTHRAPDFGFGARPEWQYGLDVTAALGATSTDTRPSITVPDAAEGAVERVLEQLGAGDRFVVMHPSVGAYSPVRAWAPERFAAVAAALRERAGVRVVAVGTLDEAASARPLVAVPGVVDLLGKTSIPELAAVLRRAALVIGADSAVVHLARAVETPAVAIFGPSNDDAWRPYGAAVHTVGDATIPDGPALVVRAGLPCSPCFYIGYGLGRRHGCHLVSCLDLVTAEEVARVALHLLARSARQGTRDAAARPAGQSVDN